MFTTLISVDDLAAHLDDPRWIIFDCRHDLAAPDAGEALYRASRLPGARFLHLDRDLAGPMTGRNGRHPVPDPDTLAAKLAAAGVRSDTQVVGYDAHGGMYAARLWWLLRWLGHDAVAVLDGGWQAWTGEGRSIETTAPAALDRGELNVSLAPLAVPIDALQKDRAGMVLVDARAPDRYRGENETLDPVGGRIPGALNRFFRDNLDATGRYKPPATLQAEWLRVLDGRLASEVVHYCGSGVSACHNVLAMEVAGLSGSRLYPGSWSEWCADRSRQMASGEPRKGEEAQ
jgi:thiosulfate/3-mercaptopyruvate sulfurtransferase